MADQDTTRFVFQAVRISEPLKLTGGLDNPFWENAVPIELGFEIIPSENTPSGQRTEVMALYDQDFLYLGFRCFDTLPGAIRAHLSDRDQIFNDDYVLISIDTYGDFQKGYEFAVNPHGIQGDLLMMGTMEDPSYDMVWQSKAVINNDGWSAEMAIPFRALNFNGDNIQEWKILVIRSVPRNNKYVLSWTPIDRNIPNLLQQGGLISGLSGIKPGRSIDLLPYTMIEQASERSDLSDPGSSFEDGSWKTRIGGGIQYSPNPGININVVINPDFSQIESDADQVTVNNTFALSYPEKRPFFMAGMDLLQTPMYYSRTINNPLAAVKGNGKTGKISWLALSAYDRNTAIVVPGEERSNTILTDEGSYTNVGRLRYDIGNESFIGVLGLSRNFTKAHNYLGGVDWNMKFWKNWYFNGELFLSHTSELNDSSLFSLDSEFGSTGYDEGFNGEAYFGTGMHLSLVRRGRIYTFNIVQNNFSPTYQTYNGMFPSVNSRMTYVYHNFTLYPNGKVIKRISLLLNANLNYNYDNLFKKGLIQSSLLLIMVGQTYFNISYLPVSAERYRDQLFSNANRFSFSLSSSPVKGLTISGNAQVGRFIYRSISPVMGRGFNVFGSIQFEPGSRLKSDISCSLAKLCDNTSGDLFYNGYILRNQTTYQFTGKLFLRNIIQYNSFTRELELYPLLNFKVNAFTMFCAGMTQGMIDYETENIGFIPVERQYFVKLQYLFAL
ncbi:MAG: carbohydrate binding family 9 domain-containing protein [Bacteroidales bacterium]|nr:carbohydrate binding family 9 domain-containing protein [Bacteroidales bacterium]